MEAVIFDLDGTILDTETVLKQVVVQMLAQYGKAEGWDADSYAGWGKRAAEACQDLVDQLELPVTADEFHAQCQPLLHESFKTARIMPGIQRLVEHLKAQNVPLAIVSSSSRSSYELKQGDCPAKRSIFQKVECVVCAEDVVEGKPSPEGYLKAAKSLGIEPGHCLVIEDSLNGVQAAKRAGMRCTAVPTLAKSEAKYEEAGADEVLHTTLDFKPERWGLAGFSDLVAGTVPRLPPLRIAGEVVRGFGRGSKSLGIPTANLPSEKLPDILCQAANGIYVGWASVGASPKVYKMVMSIGWNPTFDDVKVKTVEPHLLHVFEDDFYDEQLRLVICGYVRPELKYTTLEALIEAINGDIRTGHAALDLAPYKALQDDPFLQPDAPQPVKVATL
uniref:riboflavin kinase n=1 Tax=Eutreptiella gymnastica TaxID=73025 RepID=A0A7S4C8M5_9EUGL